MCSAVVGLSFSYGAGLCGFVRWTRVPFKLCCFQSLPRGGHQHKTRDRFCFVFFLFPFLFAFSGTQGLSEQGVFWLYAWPFWVFFVFVMTVCDFDACMFVRLKKKMWGIRLLCDVFSKTGQLNCQNIPVWIFDMTLHFACLPDVSSFPNFNGCDFLDYLQCIVACVMLLRPPFQFVLGIFYGGDQTHKGFFLKIKRYCIPKWREDRGGGVKISRKKVSILLLSYFFVFFALLKAMNLFHLYKKITLPSCDVSLECAAIL